MESENVNDLRVHRRVSKIPWDIDWDLLVFQIMDFER
jgi:hypothetical protein